MVDEPEFPPPEDNPEDQPETSPEPTPRAEQDTGSNERDEEGAGDSVEEEGLPVPSTR